jgi:hypothetical protein
VKKPETEEARYAGGLIPVDDTGGRISLESVSRDAQKNGARSPSGASRNGLVVNALTIDFEDWYHGIDERRPDSVSG